MRLYLPRHDGDLMGTDARPELMGAQRAEMGETVLVADDEATVRMIVTGVLEDLALQLLSSSDMSVLCSGLMSSSPE
jgi:hypothetical protein